MIDSPIPDNAFGAWMVYYFGSANFKDVYDSGYASYGLPFSPDLSGNISEGGVYYVFLMEI